MNVGSSTSYRRPEGETTEWEDIQRQLGNLPPLEKAQVEEEEEEEAPHDDLEDKDLDELDELEDDFADSRILEEYRRKRMAELKELNSKSKFGRLFPLNRSEFIKEVTEASKDDQWVIVLLYKDSVPNSRLLEQAIQVLAEKHKATKFMKIVSDQCIENYPDVNVPTLLVYHDGTCAKQLIGLGKYGGKSVDADRVEWVLAELGAVKTDLEDDPRNSDTGPTRAGAMYARFD